MFGGFSLRLISGLILSTASSTFAAPITYDESVSGDLPATGSPLKTFTLDVGVNSISGTTHYIGISIFPAFNLDSFAFIIPSGMQSSSTTIQVTPDTGIVTSCTWQLHKGSANSGTAGIVETLSLAVPGTKSVTALPLTSGTYHFQGLDLATGSGRYVNTSANYSFAITVLPEPAFLSLITIAGLILIARRRLYQA